MRTQIESFFFSFFKIKNNKINESRAKREEQAAERERQKEKEEEEIVV